MFAQALTQTLFGQEAAANPNTLDEEDKALIRDLSAVFGTVSGGLAGNSAEDAQIGGVVGRNAVENNYFLTSAALNRDPKEARNTYRVLKEKVDRECSSGRIHECRQDIERIIGFAKDPGMAGKYKDLQNESIRFLSQHPGLVADYLTAQYEKLDKEDKSILHRYITPGAEIVGGAAGIVISAKAGMATCAQSFGLTCGAASFGAVSSGDHLVTGWNNFGKKASEQKPTITVQGLKELGLSEQAAEYVQFSLDLFSVGKAGMSVPKAKPVPDMRVIIGNQAEIGKKLDYFLGKAKGNQHNIDRSTSMLRQLESIGLPDNVATRQYLSQHLQNTYTNPSNIIRTQENGRVVRETLLVGPKGAVKLETIWDGNRLITGEIYGPTGRFRHGGK